MHARDSFWHSGDAEIAVAEIDHALPLVIDPGWHDTVVPRVGVERTFTPSPGVEVRARAGFFFEPSPAPAQTKASNLYESARAAVTFGYGMELGPESARVTFDAFGQAQALIPREHVKAGSVSADNPGSPRATTGGWIGAAGVTVGVKF